MNEPRAPRLRWFQYSLRTLFIAVFLVSIGMSWVAVRIERARREREAAAALMKLGGYVLYDYQQDQSGNSLPVADPPGPGWLRNILGENFFATVVCVYLDSSAQRDSDLAPLKELTQLQRLELSGADVTDAGLEHLKGLTQLQRLVLTGTRVSDAGLEHLRRLTQLQLLNLAHTQVTDAGLEHLKGLAQLKELNLSYTHVTDAGLEHLKGLTQLRALKLRETNVTDEGVKALQKALPTCSIQNHYFF